MKRNSKYAKSRRTGVLFTLVCFAGAALGLWLFWADINRVLAKRSERPVGALSYKHHVVQRRFGDRLIWGPLPRESPVYNGDLVRTSDLSGATITFVSEDQISLSENSLIHIHYDARTNSFIELLSGDVSLVSVSGRIGVLAEDRKLLPDSGGVLSVRRDSRGTEARSLAGRTAISSSGGTYGLEAGQSARAGREGSVDIGETLVVSEPLPNQELRADTNPLAVTFSWIDRGLAPNEYIRLEVARDRGFTELVYSGDEYHVTETVVLLSPGAWWWRMFQAEQGSPPPPDPARDGRLTVLEAPAVSRAEPSLAPLSAPPPLALADPVGGLPLLNPAGPPAAPTVTPAAVMPEAVTPEAITPVTVAPAAVTPAAPAALALLPAPGGLFPPSETVVDAAYLKTSDRVIFTWDTVNGANGYIFTIRRGLTVNLHLVREPRFVFTNLASLDNGGWVWQVEAVSLDSGGGVRRHGEPAESRFTLDVPRPEAPLVDNPGIMYER
jgi:hypothetical protein